MDKNPKWNVGSGVFHLFSTESHLQHLEKLELLYEKKVSIRGSHEQL
jgi:hypothetical protein